MEFKRKYLKYKIKYLKLKEKVQYGGKAIWKNTANETIIATIKDTYNSLVNISLQNDSMRPGEPLVLVQFGNANDANSFSQFAGGARMSGTTVFLGSIRAQTTFNSFGISNFGRANPRPIYKVLVYELQGQISQASQASQASQSSQGSVTQTSSIIRLAKRGNFQTVNPNQAQTSGGFEKSLNEIEAAGIVPYYKDQTSCYFLLGYDPNVNLWKYFGGKKEATDSNERETAYRETKEEVCLESNEKVCYLPLKTVIFPSLENGTGIVMPKYNNSSQKWNNFYFIVVDRNIWIQNNNNQSDIAISGIKNNEVNRMKWFDINEINQLINNPNHSLGKLHPPLIAIFRDHLAQICV